MIIKQVFKNREKSLRSEEFDARAYEDDGSRILPKSKRKSLVDSAQGLGLINLQMWNPKKRHIMKLNRIVFPLRSFTKLYNSENVTVTLIIALEFPGRSSCLQCAVRAPSFHWLAVYPVDIHLSHKISQQLYSRLLPQFVGYYCQVIDNQEPEKGLNNFAETVLALVSGHRNGLSEAEPIFAVQETTSERKKE